MGFLSIFKKQTIVHDEFFGKLLYMDFKDPSKGYFEGEGYFAPVNKKIEYLIEADKTGPTNAHQLFYKKLEANYTQYVKKIIPLIEQEFRQEFRNVNENFAILDFNKEFLLECITLPRLNGQRIEWDMSFTTIHDEEHYIIIDFEEDEPVRVLIDG